jgi:hypothetical protein
VAEALRGMALTPPDRILLEAAELALDIYPEMRRG